MAPLFKKCAILGLFLIIFCLFEQIIQILQQINMNKCPSSIQCWDSNSQPLKHKSSPITTRPGLPPQEKGVYPKTRAPAPFVAIIGHFVSLQVFFWKYIKPIYSLCLFCPLSLSWISYQKSSTLTLYSFSCLPSLMQKTTTTISF